MKYLCICLSPAIDATVRMGTWPTDGCIVKDAEDTFVPGGKAVNVARWLAKRACPPSEMRRRAEGSKGTFGEAEPEGCASMCAKWRGCGRWAVAAGSAACTMPGGEPPDVDLVLRLEESMK